MILYDKRGEKKREKIIQTPRGWFLLLLFVLVFFGEIILRNEGTERDFDLLTDAGLV